MDGLYSGFAVGRDAGFVPHLFDQLAEHPQIGEAVVDYLDGWDGDLHKGTS